ncbi:hypothetical protein M758_5G130000 [Ceratodon purpureus]|nr:hypothetical protein M758_5G130000 [Ceratodon purpureus]
MRFILGVVKGEIIVNNRKRADLLSELHMEDFTPFPKKAKSSDPPAVGADAITDDTEEDEKVKGIKVADYEYLPSMPIGSLTFERVEQLRAERDKMEDAVEELREGSPKQLWEKDLHEFLVKMDAQEAQEGNDAAYEAKHSAEEGNQNSRRPAPRKPAAPKAKKAEPVDEDFADAVPALRKQAAPKAKRTEPVDDDDAVSAPAPVASKPVVTKAAPKPRARAAPKEPAKIVELDESDDDDFTSSLRDRLASCNSKSKPGSPSWDIGGSRVRARISCSESNFG